MGKHKRMLPKTEFDMCKQVCVSEEGTGRQGEGWLKSLFCTSRVSDEKHEHSSQHKLRFSCFLWPGHARTFPFKPHSITAQLLRNQTESRRSVNDAEVFSILLRVAQVQTFVCPTRPQDARYVRFLTCRHTDPFSEYTTTRRQARGCVRACGDQHDYTHSAHNHSH